MKGSTTNAEDRQYHRKCVEQKLHPAPPSAAEADKAYEVAAWPIRKDTFLSGYYLGHHAGYLAGYEAGNKQTEAALEPTIRDAAYALKRAKGFLSRSWPREMLGEVHAVELAIDKFLSEVGGLEEEMAMREEIRQFQEHGTFGLNPVCEFSAEGLTCTAGGRYVVAYSCAPDDYKYSCEAHLGQLIPDGGATISRLVDRISVDSGTSRDSATKTEEE